MSTKRLTQKEFLIRARERHGKQYDYSEVIYLNMTTPIKIGCRIHGMFYQRPMSHLHQGAGCRKCKYDRLGNERRLPTTEFVSRAKSVHRELYDYSRTIYRSSHSKVTIICPIHGEFQQAPHSHLKGQGCFACFGTPKLTGIQFVDKARKIHGNRFDYSKTDYQWSKAKVIITCRDHGDFLLRPNDHLNGIGCSKCSRKFPLTNEVFGEQSRLVHGDLYDYSKVVVRAIHRHVTIECEKHGDFKQSPANHIHGKTGCPKCKNEKMAERVRTPEFKRNRRWKVRAKERNDISF